MRTYTLSDEQEKIMSDFIEKHNRSRKCPINKQRKEYRKKNPFCSPCGGHCQYSLEITFTTIADLASVKCTCGAEQYLGEV